MGPAGSLRCVLPDRRLPDEEPLLRGCRKASRLKRTVALICEPMKGPIWSSVPRPAGVMKCPMAENLAPMNSDFSGCQ